MLNVQTMDELEAAFVARTAKKHKRATKNGRLTADTLRAVHKLDPLVFELIIDRRQRRVPAAGKNWSPLD